MNTFYFRHNKIGQIVYGLNSNKLPYYDLTFVTKGEVAYSINGNKTLLKAGDCIFLPKGTYRERTPLGACDFISFNFYDEISYDLPYYMENIINTEIKILLNLCDEIYLRHSDWTEIFNSTLPLILNLIKGNISTQKETPIVIQIKRYIRKNYSSHLTLAEIAQEVGYSPNHCDALFKKETGVSIIKHLINERIEEAKRMLDEGSVPLTEIANSVGFEDYNYFARMFKKVSGKTPTEYKALTTY